MSWLNVTEYMVITYVFMSRTWIVVLFFYILLVSCRSFLGKLKNVWVTISAANNMLVLQFPAVLPSIPFCFCQKLKFADGGQVLDSQQGDATWFTANYLCSARYPTEKDRLEKSPLTTDGAPISGEIASDWAGRGLIEGAEMMSTVNSQFK